MSYASYAAVWCGVVCGDALRSYTQQEQYLMITNKVTLPCGNKITRTNGSKQGRKACKKTNRTQQNELLEMRER